MIRKLKLKFILLSMTSLFVLLTVIIVGMNFINYRTVVAEADEILFLLSQNKGTFFGFENIPNNKEQNPNHGNRLPKYMSPELPYESRYFSVLLSDEGEVIQRDVTRIASVNAETAAEYAERAMKKDDAEGFIEQFRFVKKTEDNMVRITFLDCGRKLDAAVSFLYTSCFMALAGFAIVFFVICFFAGRIIRPIAESYEKQKRFITDAGHEIKTPLTIINTNVDILEMEFGQNESFEDIHQQTKRLTNLTNQLVYLARMEETENAMTMVDFPVSDVVSEISEPFKVLAQSQNKKLVCDIQQELTVCGNDIAVGQLVSILLENALKYSPSESTILLTFLKQNRTAVLTVSNDTIHSIDSQNLDRVFDRFYRTDASRNSSTGGHGIGLSIAKAIVIKHGGKIAAYSKDGHSFKITVTLPL